MAGRTVCLLGDLEARRELGKVGTQSDIHLHDFRSGDTHVTVIVPARYPDQLKPLSYAVCAADAAVLVVSALDARVGEQILAADAAGIRHGVVLLRNYVPKERIQPLLKDTALAAWPVLEEEDWPRIRELLAQAPLAPRPGPCLVPVDHHFDVKGVGTVVLGVVKQGQVRKGDTLMAWPDKVICPVRSIQIHDEDHGVADQGDRVGLALRNVKADQLDRGQVLAPADAGLHAHPAGARIRFALARSRFAKQPLAAGGVVHLGLDMQFVPARLEGPLPGPGTQGDVEATLEKPLVSSRGDAGVAWHVDAAHQRVLGRVTFA